MHFLIVWEPYELKPSAPFTVGLQHIFLSLVPMSGWGNYIWDQGYFAVKGNSLCLTVSHIPLNAHGSFFSISITL